MSRMNLSTLQRMLIAAALALATLVVSGCAHQTLDRDVTSRWADARQLVLVTTAGWDATQGQMRTFTRGTHGRWQAQTNAVQITVGRSGSAWGLGLHPTQDGVQKKEGDGRAPAGVFAIGTAFGYAAQATTALPYAQMRESNWCMDVVESPLYNQIVDARTVGDAAVQGSSEPMRLDLHSKGDQRYRNGFVIEHNTDAVKGAGSCIFAHLWKQPGQATAGCTAMASESMQRLYAWLMPDAYPVFVLLPEAEYQRLRKPWSLP